MWRNSSQSLWQQISKPSIAYGNQCVRCMSSHDRPVLAIRRETINVWERRAPLAPSQVQTLVKNGVKVIVQPSNRRAFNMQVKSHMGLVFYIKYLVWWCSCSLIIPSYT